MILDRVMASEYEIGPFCGIRYGLGETPIGGTLSSSAMFDAQPLIFSGFI